MGNILVSVVTGKAVSYVKLANDYMISFIISEGRCFLCANEVIGVLENEKSELTSERDNLLIRVEQADEGGEEIEKPVEMWLNEVEKLLKDVEELLKEVEGLEERMDRDNNCFKGWFPTSTRYHLCKKLVEKKEEMVKFKGKSSHIQPFSHPIPLRAILQPSEKFTYLESTKVAYNEIMEVLRDDDIHMIGVYGMGGCGKTSLAVEVGNKAQESDMFDKVILTTVSQTPNIRDIQDKMAQKLHLELTEKDEKERVQRLWLNLKKRRILVIIDDVWETFNLREIGILLGVDDYKGKLKVLITTRYYRVCDSMECQRKIHLRPLLEDESWTLFRKYANVDDEFSRLLDDVPRQLCAECRGLPIAIKAVGSSLKGNSDDDDWAEALYNSRHIEGIDDEMRNEDGVITALSCLKVSYDHLKDKVAEMLFLICSVFPEDYEIPVEDLIRYTVGLGLGGRRSRIQKAINKLLDSSLLMHVTERDGYVKMHDMVREVAIWIANRFENRKILVNFDKPLDTLIYGDYFAVSSWRQENQISLEWDAPNLEILLLQRETFSSLDLSNATFEGLGGLKVFSAVNIYSGEQSLSLPPSIHSLTNLGTLRLNEWKLSDISFITSLPVLEVLDLQGSSFNVLPDEIGKLEKLKLLDLSGCHIEKSYNGALAKCSQLEEIYVLGYPTEGYIYQSYVDIFTLPKLQRFVIKKDKVSDNNYAERRLLELWDFNVSNLKASRKNILQTAEIILLRRLQGCKNIIPDMVRNVGVMNGLASLFLGYCEEIECIFDTAASHSMVDAFIPKLAELRLWSMKNLKELCRGSHLQVLRFFEKLEKLEIQNCHRLSHIFPSQCSLQSLKILTIVNCSGGNHTVGEVLFSASVAQSLQKLEKLTIKCYNELKHVIACGGEHTVGEIVPISRNSHSAMPNLKEIHISHCDLLESVFPICYAKEFGQLQEIQISWARNLKYVFGECNHENRPSKQYQNQIHLHVLKLSCLENLVGICPQNYGAVQQSVRELTMVDCKNLATLWMAMIIGSDQRHQHLNEQNHLPSTPPQVELPCVPEENLVSKVGPNPRQILSLQNLQSLKVDRCGNLKSLFSVEAHKSLPELTYLDIHNCQELEQIIVENDELVQLPNAQVFFPKLRYITVGKCNNLKSLFSVAMVRMLPHLTVLHIAHATQLEEIFRNGASEEDGTTSEMEIVLPNITNIILDMLPSFVDISRSRKLRAVKIKELFIYECPKMTPRLGAVQVSLKKATRIIGEDEDSSSDC